MTDLWMRRLSRRVFATSGPPVKFKMVWGPWRLKCVKSARDHRWPRLYANTYPGCWIGLALYWRQHGISWLWGRPGGIRANQ